MRLFRGLLALVLALTLSACGGGGGNAGTSPFSSAASSPTTTTATATASSIDVLASSVQVGSGGDQITLTAIVKDSSNTSLASAPVRFAASSGNLTSAATTTDTAGVATANFSSGSDKNNRSVTVTVTSGAASGVLTLQVVGTTLAYSGVSTVALSNRVTVSVKAQDSKGAVIPNLAIATTSTLHNGLSAAALTTDAQGNATVDYTATAAGTDTLTFTGAGASATASIQVSAANFAFISPAAAVQIPVGTPQSLTVRYLLSGVAQSGKTVNFAATAGAVTPSSAVTNSLGDATVSISSATASPATVQATLVGASEAAQATLPIEFIALTPAKLVLQVSPTALGPNPGGATAQQAQLVALVTDANGNPVKGVTVNFNRVADPSGGNLTQASAATDSNGQASVQYIAGANTTASNGVQIQATVAGSSTVLANAFLTVNQSALFIALGTGNTISNLDDQTYKKDWVVYVTDANGVPVPNMNLTIKVLPVLYGKGTLTFTTAWVPSSNVVFCPTEDINFNGILDAGEDFNGSGTLEPGNVISVTASGTAGAASTGTVRTDATGRATISLIYAESYVPWVRVRLRAEALVAGTESSKEATFTVAGASTDFTNQSTPPAGQTSPFGVNGCSSPN